MKSNRQKGIKEDLIYIDTNVELLAEGATLVVLSLIKFIWFTICWSVSSLFVRPLFGK